MNRDFDLFVKQHLEDILCQVEKEQALVRLRKQPNKARKYAAQKHHIVMPQVQLQDCAISPTFSHNHL